MKISVFANITVSCFSQMRVLEFLLVSCNESQCRRSEESLLSQLLQLLSYKVYYTNNTFPNGSSVALRIRINSVRFAHAYYDALLTI